MTLPEWLDPLYSPDEMRAADSFAIERCGIFELELAEKAGAGLASAVEDVAESGPIRVVVGPGNNGGDGLVAARLLREKGYRVDVLAPLPLEGLEGVPRTNLERLRGPAPQAFDAALLRDSGAIVDALLGTGVEGAVGEPLDEVIVAINSQGAPVVAADVPSGVNAATGEVEGPAVEASVTSTNHAPKIGLYVAQGARNAGSVRVVDIGIPRGEPGAGLAGLTSRRVLRMVPPRSRYDSVLDAGTVLVAGGGRYSLGAPSLAALAAMRSGAGLVRVAVPTSTAPIVSSRLLEAPVYGLREDQDGCHVEDGAEMVVRLAMRNGEPSETIVLGPGMRCGPGETSFALAIGRANAIPIVISAGALSAFATQDALDGLAGRSGDTILIVWPDELGLLLGEVSAMVEGHTFASARALADRSGSVVLLEGVNPIVVSPGGPCAVGAGDTGALVTYGTTDVLAGLVGALLSKGLEPFSAAAAGVFARAEAGARAARRVGGADYTIASDVIDALPESLSTLQ
jgi:ADP-dependent NAD(P)H-hydrate dehydratase / NAD(P)H-hydrate epimerase